MLNKIIELDWRKLTDYERNCYSHGDVEPMIAVDTETDDVYTLTDTLLKVKNPDGVTRCYKLIHVVSM